MSISSGFTPAWPKAAGALCAPALVVMSPPFSRYFVASPLPMIQTGFFLRSRATSGATKIAAPPPSETMQHSNRWSGSAMMRDSRTSFTVISSTLTNWRSVMALTASGLRMAWWRVATEICASCSEVVPYSCMWRWATIA
jgi:hypothetical protein